MSISLPDLAQNLLACLCDALADAQRPACCDVVWSQGLPPMDMCCPDFNGNAWVRFAQMSATTPGNGKPCIVSWSVTLQMGVYRCVTVGDDGTPPPPEVHSAEAAGFMTDAMAMRSAVACCVNGSCDYSVVAIGPATPIGPRGAVAGVVMNVTYRL